MQINFSITAKLLIFQLAICTCYAISIIKDNELKLKSFKDNDYCDSNLCQNFVRHIGCRNSGKFAAKCPKDAKVVPLNKDYQQFIVHLHNECRNKMASGTVKGYAPAARMGVVEWDDELAYLAELNAKQCKIEHDLCRNTVNFPYAGQNLALGYLLQDHSVEWAITNFTAEWFIELEDANQKIMDEFYRPPGKPIGHFTLMVADRQTKIGCAMVKFTEKLYNYDYKVHVFTCNYSFNNIYSQPVYRKGKSCSKCKSGCHSYYKSLCSEKEIIKPDPYF